MDFSSIINLIPPQYVHLALDILVIMGGTDLVLGIVSKWTPWKWDDNVYSILHEAVASLKELFTEDK